METFTQKERPIIYAQTVPTFQAPTAAKARLSTAFCSVLQRTRVKISLSFTTDSGYSPAHMGLPQCDFTRIERQRQRQKNGSF